MNLRQIILTLLATVFVAIVATGCQTSKGFGKDVEHLGDRIQEKASK